MKRLILILILLISTLNIYSQETPKIYLTTIGPGDELFLRWGHFAIVVDYEDKNDVLYDYGNFSFQEVDFVPNFIRGVMTYFKYRKSADYELKAYIRANRTITMQELNLTPEQVYHYIEKLQSEVRPENRYYQYDHYYNNCVSQMSDFLNEVTNGEFYKGTEELTNRSFRDLSRDYISSSYIYNNLIMFLLGSKVDENITKKESLFLPDYTKDRAAEVMIPDGKGGIKPLIKSSTIIYKSVDRAPVIVNSKPKILLNLLVGILLSVVIFFLNKNRVSSGITSIIIGVICGIGGSLLFFMSFFTGHYYIHNNWNLVMINPITLILIAGGIMKLSSRLKPLGFKIISIYSNITLIAVAIMILLKLFGIINQDNGEIITLITPIILVNSSIFKRFYIKQEL